MTRQAILLTAAVLAGKALVAHADATQARDVARPQVHRMTADDFLDETLGATSTPGAGLPGLQSSGRGGLNPSNGLVPSPPTVFPPRAPNPPQPSGTINTPTTPGPKGDTYRPPCTIRVRRPTGDVWLPGASQPAPQPVSQPVFLGVVGHACRHGGVHVNQVISGSLAQRMGFEVGDKILAINHRAINSMDDLRAAMAQPTRSFTFVIRNVRNGRIVSDTLRL